MSESQKYTIDDITVTATGADMSLAEIEHYIKVIRARHPNKQIERIDISYKEGGDGCVDFTVYFKPVNFDRIRRITGYLVGTLDRFNDAKRAEEHDRVKHTLPPERRDG